MKDDVQKYIASRKRTDKRFVKGFDSGYQRMKRAVMAELLAQKRPGRGTNREAMKTVNAVLREVRGEMKAKLFNELLESVKQAKAIERGEMKPLRVFKVRTPNARTRRTLKASKAGRNVKRFRSKRALLADLGL